VRLPIAIFLFLAGAALACAEERANTPQDVFDQMRRNFHPDKAAGVHATYEWQISGPRGGDWWVEVDDRKFKMGRGHQPHANVTFVISDKDWVAISNDQLSGLWAYVTGRLKIHGDQSLARKLDTIF
jgi:putative sterol carrier protein